MAHFAEINDNFIVQRVIVVDNAVLLNENGIECDYLGVAFCQSLYGAHTKWVQASYNGNKYKNFAGRGDVFDPVRHCFHAPQPYPSWHLDEATAQWHPPTPHPSDGLFYEWSEDTLNWVKIPDHLQPTTHVSA